MFINKPCDDYGSNKSISQVDRIRREAKAEFSKFKKTDSFRESLNQNNSSKKNVLTSSKKMFRVHKRSITYHIEDTRVNKISEIAQRLNLSISPDTPMQSQEKA